MKNTMVSVAFRLSPRALKRLSRSAYGARDQQKSYEESRRHAALARARQRPRAMQPLPASPRRPKAVPGSPRGLSEPPEAGRRRRQGETQRPRARERYRTGSMWLAAALLAPCGALELRQDVRPVLVQIMPTQGTTVPMESVKAEVAQFLNSIRVAARRLEGFSGV